MFNVSCDVSMYLEYLLFEMTSYIPYARASSLKTGRAAFRTLS